MAKYKKIYVMAPYGHATGGVELAHQLVDILRDKGCDAYIVYVDGQIISEKQDVTTQYISYNIKTTKTIEDSADNILVLPEIYFDYIYVYRNIQLGCWWMSVDFHYEFYSCLYDLVCFKLYSGVELFRYVKRSLCNKVKYRNSVEDLRQMGDRITHFYQSTYAQQHLYSKGFTKVLPLTDYINTELISSEKSTRKDIVLYNPAKGYQYTKRIIEKNPDIEFVALKGFSRSQLLELLKSAKLYIDFGNFPGKDRLPREAVINDCCIITGRAGASGFYEDVAIPDKYKFTGKNSDLESISNMIRYVLCEYENCINDFSFYKTRILNERSAFYNEIENAFVN